MNATLTEVCTISRLVARTELERGAARLRQVADELRHVAPSVSVKADALAREAEMRIQTLERRSEHT